jgi:hypothetical protein
MAEGQYYNGIPAGASQNDGDQWAGLLLWLAVGLQAVLTTLPGRDWFIRGRNKAPGEK